MPGDPYSDPITGVLYNKLGLSTAAGLEAAEREITHAALILLHESPVSPSYDLPHLREIVLSDTQRARAHHHSGPPTVRFLGLAAARLR